MRKFLLLLIIFFSLSNCKKYGECINEEPLLQAEFYDKTTGSPKYDFEMADISIQGVGSPTLLNNSSNFKKSYGYAKVNSISMPLNITVDSSMFIIKNNTISDTVLFYYKRAPELLERNCDQKGGYVIRPKGISVGFSTLDSVIFNKQNNEINSLSIYY